MTQLEQAIINNMSIVKKAIKFDLCPSDFGFDDFEEIECRCPDTCDKCWGRYDK